MGASEVKLDTVTRKLRADGVLATHGRGPYAHDVTSEEAAKVFIAYMGSSKAAFAASRLNALASIISKESGKNLLQAVTDLLTDESLCSNISIVRVSRRSDRATLIYLNGMVESFCSSTALDSKLIGTEGFMTGDVFRTIRLLLGEESPARRKRSKVVR